MKYNRNLLGFMQTLVLISAHSYTLYPTFILYLFLLLFNSVKAPLPLVWNFLFYLSFEVGIFSLLSYLLQVLIFVYNSSYLLSTHEKQLCIFHHFAVVLVSDMRWH